MFSRVLLYLKQRLNLLNEEERQASTQATVLAKHQEMGTFICTTFVPKETECTYSCFVSYNLNSQMAKIKGRRRVRANRCGLRKLKYTFKWLQWSKLMQDSELTATSLFIQALHFPYLWQIFRLLIILHSDPCSQKSTGCQGNLGHYIINSNWNMVTLMGINWHLKIWALPCSQGMSWKCKHCHRYSTHVNMYLLLMSKRRSMLSLKLQIIHPEITGCSIYSF